MNIFDPVYLLCGDDNYTKRKFEEEIEKKLLKKYKTCDRVILDGSEVDLKRVIDELEGGSLFAAVRIIVVRNADKLLKESKKFKDYLKEFNKKKDPPSFIIVELIADKKSITNLKGITLREFKTPYENKISDWIKNFATIRGKNISYDAANLLLFYCGRNLFNISNEIEKLIIAYPDKDTYDIEDVQTISGTHRKNDIFGYLNALAGGDEKKAIRLLENLLTYRTEPIQILALIKWKLQQMITVKSLLNKGLKENDIVRKAALNPPFLYRGFCGNIKKFSMKRLLKNYDNLKETDLKLKSTSIDKFLLLEKFTCEFVTIQEPGARIQESE